MTIPLFDKLGRCARCMRQCGITTGIALVTMLAASSSDWTLLSTVAIVALAATASLSLAHGVAYLLRPRAIEPRRHRGQETPLEVMFHHLHSDTPIASNSSLAPIIARARESQRERALTYPG